MAAGSNVSVVVMGVQGIGKSTIGRMLAKRLDVAFIEGDELHSAHSIALMAAGTPLTDDDREPWLHAVGEALAASAADGGAVLACSALRREYRDLIREHDPLVYFVEPRGPIELVRERVASRTHEYMPASLLPSQYDTLEPLAADERGIRVSVTATAGVIVDQVLADYLSQTRERE